MLKRTHSETGQGIVEFAIVLAIVAVFVLIVLVLMGPQIGNVFSNGISVL
jgi:Flp pilus assembly pilin Flp